MLKESVLSSSLLESLPSVIPPSVRARHGERGEHVLVPKKGDRDRKQKSTSAASSSPLGCRKAGILEEFRVARAWRTEDKRGRDGLGGEDHQGPYKPFQETHTQLGSDWVSQDSANCTRVWLDLCFRRNIFWLCYGE